MSTQMLFGGISLENYLSSPSGLTEERREQIDKLIDSLGGNKGSNALNVERLPLELLLNERRRYDIMEVGYKSLDPSFLSMHNRLKIKQGEINVPRFSVYSSSDEGFNSFSIIFDRGSSSTNFFGQDMRIILGAYNIPRIFGEQLVKGLGFTPEHIDKYSGIPRKVAKNYPYPENLKLESSFHGLIPDSTKERIKRGKGIFEKGLYLIAETKPEEWNVKYIAKDPIIVGVLENECYLIDHFLTTPIESYVVREFSS